MRKAVHIRNSLQSTKSQKLQKRMSLSALTDGRKRSTTTQHCIRITAREVVKSGSVYLINICGVREVIALKYATALILDRYTKYMSRLYKMNII